MAYDRAAQELRRMAKSFEREVSRPRKKKFCDEFHMGVEAGYRMAAISLAERATRLERAQAKR